MKINWGTKLAFFAIAFMIFVVSMVITISRQDVPLVEDNYYEKGLKYQQEIDNNQSLGKQVTMHVQGNEVWIINASKQVLRPAKIGYYRPSDPALDQEELLKAEIAIGDTARWPIPNLQSGKWKVSLHWNWEGKEYELSEDINR